MSLTTDSYDASVALDRKLSPEESRELKILLMPYFHATGDNEASPEDINDLLDYAFAMVNNQKSVEYVITELVGMEMDFCNSTIAEKVGGQLSGFLKKAMGGGEDHDKFNGGKVASLKSTSSDKGNALTMSGALGASREGGRNKNNASNQKDGKANNNKQQQGDKRRDDRRGDRNNNSSRGGGGRDERNNDRDGRGSNRERNNNRGGRGGRATHKEAFDRLANSGNNRRGRDNDRSGRGRRDDDRRDARGGRGGRDDRDGRGGRGGRDGRRDGGGRGGRFGGRGDRGDRASGNRRTRDEYEDQGEEQDFVPMRDGGRGRGRGGRGRGNPEGIAKRPRYDDDYDEGYGDGGGYYDEGYGYGGYHGYGGRGGYGGYQGRGGRGRGRFGGRGRGRGGRGRGRGRGDTANESGAGDGAADANANTGGGGGSQEGDAASSGANASDAANHPSPLVQASYSGGRGGYGGRGRFGRGRGGRGRGGGRAHIVNLIQSKTWVRKKPEDASAASKPADAAPPPAV